MNTIVEEIIFGLALVIIIFGLPYVFQISVLFLIAKCNARKYGFRISYSEIKMLCKYRCNNPRFFKIWHRLTQTGVTVDPVFLAENYFRIRQDFKSDDNRMIDVVKFIQAHNLPISLREAFDYTRLFYDPVKELKKKYNLP